MGDANWETSYRTRGPPPAGSRAAQAAAIAAAKAGTPKVGAGTNKGHGAGQGMAQKMDSDDVFGAPTGVSHSFKVALQKARQAKQMNQQQLAQAINERAQVINEYESGKAVPNGAIIQKLNKVLGVTLPKARPQALIVPASGASSNHAESFLPGAAVAVAAFVFVSLGLRGWHRLRRRSQGMQEALLHV
eukprot:gnl/TRDRNA2_/TRDRNA2_197946_c0_seq1.p1 gnl/TRDRNA2_/TRDRNA2_197946_c0~~gnl/TRDRNA2_/TRDRNA2_197946_c0_seq1.p1  ORF type:complete len:189 (-),score=35.72 gnl/TRDRNA2_/TRDRNA2_197946_c0_seq1:91-657(-)